MERKRRLGATIGVASAVGAMIALACTGGGGTLGGGVTPPPAPAPGGEGGAAPIVGTPGAPCEKDEDCPSTLCIPTALDAGAPKQCAGACEGLAASSTARCTLGPSCFPGWVRWHVSNASGKYCRCDPGGKDECNGRDDDCDGELDDEGDETCAAADGGEGKKCDRGRCVACPARCGGACTDLATDRGNCGSCGTACPPATATTAPVCSDEGCATLTAVAPTRGRIGNVAVDAASVYFTEERTLYRCPIGGCAGAPEIVSAQIGYANALTSDGAHLYWYAESRLNRCAVTGCGSSPTVIHVAAPGAGNHSALRILGDGRILFATGGYNKDGKISICPASGCTGVPFDVGSGLSFQAVTTDAANVYFVQSASADTPGALRACPLTGCAGAPTTIVDGLRLGGAIAAQDGSVYFSTAPEDGRPGSLMKCPAAGCGAGPTVLTALAQAMEKLRVYDGGLLWWQSGSGRASGILSSCGLGGCPRPSILAAGLDRPTDVAVTPDAFFVASDGYSPAYDDGMLRRLPR